MASRSATGGASAGSATARYLVWLVIGLFFIWGGTTSLNDVLIPKLKGLYSLSYAEVMLTQFAFFTGYFVFALPAGWLISRIGYLRGVVVGLVIMAVGAALFWPSSLAGLYWPYLVALFIIAGGITCLQVAANPLIAALGDERTSSSRLTFAQAFNSLGTTVWPWVGSNLILAGAASRTDPAKLSGDALAHYRLTESHVVSDVYVGIAIVLVVVAAIFWWQRNAVRDEKATAVGLGDALALLGHRRVAFGVAALFAYVGAEVAIGSMLVNYLQLPTVMALSPESAGKHLSYYWGGAMIGRFIGAGLLQRIEPGRLLIAFSAINAVLIGVSMSTTGDVAGWSLIAVGLFNSIMFPTVFALALQGLGARTAEGAGLLCMAIVGGAIIPLATGKLADMSTLAGSLIIPLVCYGVIAAFGFFGADQGVIQGMVRAFRATLATASLLLSTATFAQQSDPRSPAPQANNPSQSDSVQPGALGKAGANQQAPKTPDALFGDWGGIRTRLDDAGVEATFGYKGEAAGNVSGGARKDATETGQFALTAAFDAGKIAGIDGGTLQTTITFRQGHDLGQRAGLGTLQQVQEVYGRGQTWRLTELWYQQVLADGAVVLKVGRMPAGEFNTFDCDFQNLTFCGAPAGNITGNYWFNYPIAQWTGWAKFRRGDVYLKLGANEDNRNNLDNAFFFSRGGAQGAILHAEAGYTPGFDGGKLPGRVQAGFWFNTSRDQDVLLDIDHNRFALTGLPARSVKGQYGLYVQGEQQITGEGKEDPVSGVITRKSGLNGFFNVTRNDPATATTLDQETVGFYVNKPFAGRPDDQLGVAVGRTHYNGRAAEALVLATPGSEKPDSEYAMELYYGFHAIRGVVLRPNLQYVIDPGGYSRGVTDVVVIGGRFDINF